MSSPQDHFKRRRGDREVINPYNETVLRELRAPRETFNFSNFENSGIPSHPLTPSPLPNGLPRYINLCPPLRETSP